MRAPALFQSLRAFVKLARPVFLLGGVLLYGLGLAMAAAQGAVIAWPIAVLGQVLVSAIQLMAQCANEYYDIDADRGNAAGRTALSGGSGVLPAGGLAPACVLAVTRACAAVAIVLAALVALINPLAAGIALLALFLSWFYSAPPLALMSSGWGELTASLVVAVLVPVTGYVLQTTAPVLPVLLVCVPLLLMHWAMLIAFELPDRPADQAAGKHTQTVRLGVRRARILHTALLAGAFVSLGLAIVGTPDSARFLWIAIPALCWQTRAYIVARDADRRSMTVLVFGAVGLFAGTTALWLAGFASELLQSSP